MSAYNVCFSEFGTINVSTFETFKIVNQIN